MQLLDLTLPSCAENIALDEALLEVAESANSISEILRFWEPAQPTVIVGRSSRVEQEVDTKFCRSRKIPIYRRASGGAAILTGPGCLMYALLLDYRRRPILRMLDESHRYVMSRMKQAIHSLGIGVEFRGTCDLTIGDRKVSGNAMKCKRNWFIYHGTMICQSMEIELIEHCLRMPRRQPEYRRGRAHTDFISKIPALVKTVKSEIVRQWACDGECLNWPSQVTHKLVAEKYSKGEWNYCL
jgi:lipoate-protein ligase A